METKLRHARIHLLTGAAKKDQLSIIITGHQQDDQYETLLYRLSSGSGLVGLAGIPEVNGYFRRPLLDYTKVQSSQN